MATKQKISRLTDIAATHSALDFPYLSKKSQDWLRAKVGQIKNPVRISKDIAAERNRNRGGGNSLIGGLYFMQYDPITKDRMEYYDIFPLIILLEIDGTHFTGLNLHYLPPRFRAQLLDALSNNARYNEENDIEKFRNAQMILKFAAAHPIYKHCLKRYLVSQRLSKFLKVEPHEWETSLYLPVQQFQKASPNKVWQDSTKRG